MTNRHYDVVLYGASGFTGQQTVHYFAQHAPHGRIRWAIAGRNRAKLEAVKAQLGVSAETVDVLVAESHDQAAVDAMVAQTRVILSTAGPFALYSNAIVDACVRLRTHYVDITGETHWVKTLIDRYHEQAAADGTRIIPFCGFDSVPSDLGTYLLVRYIQHKLRVTCTHVKAYFQMYGGVNGGTLASMFALYDSGQAAQTRDLFLLNPAGEHSQEELTRSRDPVLPAYDTDSGGWVGPFFMGPINTRVVRRSQALYAQWQESYGPGFTYQEYLKFNGPLGAFKALGVTGGIALVQGTMQLAPLRNMLRPLLPQPGSGPSTRTMDNGWFRCELVGHTNNRDRIRGYIADRGDPGNRATVKFLCESALSLVLHERELPGGHHRGGILTPAAGLGNVLAHRLRAAGMTIEIGL